MASTTSRGNYYKRKTKVHFEKLGYTVQLTEFMTTRPIGPGKVIFVKKDVFGSDGIAMKEDDIIFWNSKHTTTGNISVEKSRGRKDYRKFPFPVFVKRQLVIWQPRKKIPDIISM